MRFWVTGFAIAATACASSGSDAPTDAMSGPGDDAMVVASSCPIGEFATGIAIDGTLLCAPIDDAAAATLTESCSLYFGWNDNCNGCTTLPARWGEVSGTDCNVGLGATGTCANATLGGVTLPLFGLNPGGDSDDNDKFHLGLRCETIADEPSAGPCEDGSFLSGILGESTQCVTARGAVSSYLTNSCRAYFGWRDNCDGCTSAPSKWGRADTNECMVGAGVNNTCSSFVLGEDSVFTLGVNTDGNVNGDDKFYLGFQCTGAEASEGTSFDSCPPNELVVGIDEQGRVQCASPALAAEAAVQDGCFLYFGWRDSCSGCNTPPTKWGRVSHTGCENGNGLDNTCAATPLDGTSIELFGLNIDGDMDGNDKLYLGVACPGAF